jgi:hypothetical protein
VAKAKFKYLYLSFFLSFFLSFLSNPGGAAPGLAGTEAAVHDIGAARPLPLPAAAKPAGGGDTESPEINGGERRLKKIAIV